MTTRFNHRPRIGRTALVLLALTAFGAPEASAERSTELLWSFQANGNMQSIAAIPDIDGDGGPDVAFEGYENGPSGVDHVFAIRGRSSGVGTVVWSARPIGGLSSGGGWGDNCLRLGSDVSGDGVADLLLGTAWGGRTAYALDATDGSTLWGYDTYVHYGQSNAGWIYAMDDLGDDLTDDGVAEVVFCSGSNNDRIHCVDGRTGAFVWARWGQDSHNDVRSCPDIDGDGIRDVIAALGDNTPISPRVIALSGADGQLIWERPVQSSLWNLVFVDDLDGDGVAEIVPSQWGSTLYCINGRTGAIAWSSVIGAQQRVAALDDVNGDGYRDVAVGFNTASLCQAVSGFDGSILWTRPTSDWTWAVDRVGDCSGDGINDVAVGDFDGWIRVLDGTNGAVVWEWLNPTGDKIKTIRGVPDLNGNGVPDVVAGTQLLYGGTGGDVYALEGNTQPTSVETESDGRISSRSYARLGAATPSPSYGIVRWSIETPRPTTDGAGTRATVFDTGGRVVRRIACRTGAAVLEWDGRAEDGRPVPAGVYFARVDGAGAGETRAVVIVR